MLMMYAKLSTDTFNFLFHMWNDKHVFNGQFDNKLFVSLKTSASDKVYMCVCACIMQLSTATSITLHNFSNAINRLWTTLCSYEYHKTKNGSWKLPVHIAVTTLQVDHRVLQSQPETQILLKS